MALAAIPLGVLIDRYSRARLLWSLTVLNLLGSVWTACVTDFAVLCAARSVVGLSAFAINPVAFSLVAFAVERDRMYVWFTLAVLIVLVYSIGTAIF